MVETIAQATAEKNCQNYSPLNRNGNIPVLNITGSQNLYVRLKAKTIGSFLVPCFVKVGGTGQVSECSRLAPLFLQKETSFISEF